MVNKTTSNNKDDATPTNKGAFDVMAHPSRPVSGTANAMAEKSLQHLTSSGNNAGVSGNTQERESGETNSKGLATVSVSAEHPSNDQPKES